MNPKGKELSAGIVVTTGFLLTICLTPTWTAACEYRKLHPAVKPRFCALNVG